MKTVLVGLLSCLAITLHADTPSVPQRAPDFIPLGVYWPGECTFGEYQIPKLRWAKVDAALDDLAAHHVNAIWLTHVNAAEGAEFAKRAATRGIYLVASLGELAGENEAVRQGGHQALIRDVLAAWGDAPKPVAWGLGDEPRAGYMAAMAAYAKAWHDQAPGEPVATVVMHGDIESAAGAGFDALCADVYPFFSSGNPNDYGMLAWAAWTQNARRLAARHPRPWMMGQAYQEPWGPYAISPDGNIVYLPGGGPHWAMPTPEQIRWQAYSAFACGARGMFYFLYRWPIKANPEAPACSLPAAVKEPTDSRAPRALVHEDGRTTPQFEALGEAYAWLTRHAELLSTLAPVPAPEAWETLPASAGGNVVSVFTQSGSGTRYLMVVSGYDLPPGQEISVTLGPHIVGLTSVETGTAVPVTVAVPFRTARVALAPASAALFECQVDTANLPVVYNDDFSTDKYKTDAMAVQRVTRWPGMVSAADGGAGADAAFVVYDLEKLLGPIAPGGFRMLLYQGGANPPAYRGAFWSASEDGKTFVTLSDNEFGRQILFGQRYLKVGLSWTGSSSPMYGNLARISILQWKCAATGP